MFSIRPLSSRCAEEQKMNNTELNASIKCFRDTSVTAVVFPCLYSFLFIAALVLNSLAAWIFFSIPSTSIFVVFLKNVVRRRLLTFQSILLSDLCVKVLSYSILSK